LSFFSLSLSLFSVNVPHHRFTNPIGTNNSASNDILRIYDLAQDSTSNDTAAKRQHKSAVPFTIVPGHRGGVIAGIHVDPTCRFMLSASGNRGWDGGTGTEVLLGYEIGVLDERGGWHK
jgi:transcriptional activator SPT8